MFQQNITSSFLLLSSPSPTPTGWPPGSDAYIVTRNLPEGSKLVRHDWETHCFRTLPWPRDVAEQCSRHREKGAHCLSIASLRAAGVGEPRREPEGPQYGQHGFGHFDRNQSGSAAGPKPGNIEYRLVTTDVVL